MSCIVECGWVKTSTLAILILPGMGWQKKRSKPGDCTRGSIQGRGSQADADNVIKSWCLWQFLLSTQQGWSWSSIATLRASAADASVIFLCDSVSRGAKVDVDIPKLYESLRDVENPEIDRSDSFGWVFRNYPLMFPV
jgi:hypothetical protein